MSSVRASSNTSTFACSFILEIANVATPVAYAEGHNVDHAALLATAH
jgi:hypothetical protein